MPAELPELVETAHRQLPELAGFLIEPGKAMAQPSMALVRVP